MARRRMFSLDVVDTDRFLDMPTSAQNLYYSLGMRADDDGFVSNPKRIAASCGSCIDDLRLLITKDYIIPFDSGVIVITDWKVNNQIKSDRYKPTQYTVEEAQLRNDPAGRYISGTKMEPVWNQDGTNLEPQVRLGKDKLDKKECRTAAPPTPRFKPPTEDEMIAYFAEKGGPENEARKCYNYYLSNGWKVGRNPMKSWKGAANNWMCRNNPINQSNGGVQNAGENQRIVRTTRL